MAESWVIPNIITFISSRGGGAWPPWASKNWYLGIHQNNFSRFSFSNICNWNLSCDYFQTFFWLKTNYPCTNVVFMELKVFIKVSSWVQMKNTIVRICLIPQATILLSFFARRCPVSYSETLNNEFIEIIHLMSYSSLSDNGMFRYLVF